MESKMEAMFNKMEVKLLLGLTEGTMEAKLGLVEGKMEAMCRTPI
jgi:hypothetical protein